MDKARTCIVVVTAWLSFLAALWLFLLRIVSWEAPVAMLVVVVFVFGFNSVGYAPPDRYNPKD